jgi:glycerol uptake facilitator-like aquaporin
VNTAALNYARFVDQATAVATVAELDQVDPAVSLTQGVTLHAGMRNGIPMFVVQVAGAAELSAVISTQPLDA